MSTTTCPECGDLFEKDAAIESDMRGSSSLNHREQEPVHYRWRLHFTDREPLEVAFSPPASHTDVLDFYPDALAAEPIAEDMSRIASCA